MKSTIAGLYLLTPDAGVDDLQQRLSKTEAALRVGVRCLQYRDKNATPEQRLQAAQALRELTRRYNTALIVNDDLSLALSIQADGLHIGRDDGDPAAARRKLLPHMLLGVSCYNELERARAAAAAGADYVAFGSAFESPTKPAAVRAPLSLFKAARTMLGPGMRLVGIGGISAANIGQLRAAGADAAAVITAVYDAQNPGQAATELISAFNTNHDS